MNISQKAIDLIIEFEVSSKERYERLYQKPIWPGVNSGVTIGIGYDLGHVTLAEFRKDWSGKLNKETIKRLESAVGKKGETAKLMTPGFKDIKVSWESAIYVFKNTSLKKYYDMTVKALPNTDKLSPDSMGALVSLVYNRGASFNSKGDRYKEMRAIKAHMTSKDFSKIPEEIKSMKRLWTLKGLHTRRDKEAALFSQGLTKPSTSFQKKEAAGITILAGLAATAVTFFTEYWMYIVPAAIVGAGLLIYYTERKFF